MSGAHTNAVPTWYGRLTFVGATNEDARVAAQSRADSLKAWLIENDVDFAGQVERGETDYYTVPERVGYLDEDTWEMVYDPIKWQIWVDSRVAAALTVPELTEAHPT